MSVHCRKGPKMKVLGIIWKNHRNTKTPEDSGSQKMKCRRARRGPDMAQARAQAWPPRAPPRATSSPISRLLTLKLRENRHTSTKSSDAAAIAEARFGEQKSLFQ